MAVHSTKAAVIGRMVARVIGFRRRSHARMVVRRRRPSAPRGRVSLDRAGDQSPSADKTITVSEQ